MMDEIPIAINGRFLTKRPGGVQRYACEITTALDRLIAADPHGLGRRQWRLVVPPDAADRLNLRAIETATAGWRTGHLWEQIDLLGATRGWRLINLCNSGPMGHRSSIVIVHDAAPYRTPDNFGWRYGMIHRTLGRLLARTARLGTVSYFSRGELADVFGLAPEAIFVAGNGCDHLAGRPRSPDIVHRLGLAPLRYLLFVGSPTPNKNLSVALDAFDRLKREGPGREDVRFVVAGSLNKAVFGSASPDSVPGLVVASGLDDAEVAGLYQSAATLIFPSRYEGFGIPPLEAMVCGCAVLAADIPAVREVCANAAVYFAPDDAAGLARLMAAALDRTAPDPALAARAAARVAHYTWAAAAGDLARAVTGQAG